MGEAAPFKRIESAYRKISIVFFSANKWYIL